MLARGAARRGVERGLERGRAGAARRAAAARPRRGLAQCCTAAREHRSLAGREAARCPFTRLTALDAQLTRRLSPTLSLGGVGGRLQLADDRLT